MPSPPDKARRSRRRGDGSLLISELTLRKAVGLLGVALPVIVAMGCWLRGGCTTLESSISAYYGTDMRDVFVGILFAIALFMFSYRGYEWRDEVAGKVACVCALGVALFPVTSSVTWVPGVHLTLAALLFVTFSYFSLCLFTRTDSPGHLSPQKVWRNRVYIVCGIAMLAFIAFIGVYYLFGTGTWLARLEPVFWLESFALWAFGISWGVKGEAIPRLNDPREIA